LPIPVSCPKHWDGKNPGRRDICIAREPHVVVAAPRNEFFIDPSHTDRLRFNASQADDLTPSPHGVTVRTLKESSDADAMNRVFAMERLTEPE
jgi:hypothetical protein